MLVSFLRRLLGQKQDTLLERAGNLVQAAQVSAVGMFTPLLDSFPILRQVDIQQGFHPDGGRCVRGFEDCKRLFEREFDRLTAAGHEPRLVASDAVGKWIVWNVLRRAPQTNEEGALARATGTMVTHAFFGWWDK